MKLADVNHPNARGLATTRERHVAVGGEDKSLVCGMGCHGERSFRTDRAGASSAALRSRGGRGRAGRRSRRGPSRHRCHEQHNQGQPWPIHEGFVLARRFGGAIISRATSTNARSAGDTCARLGKYRKKPGTLAAYGSSTVRSLPLRTSGWRRGKLTSSRRRTTPSARRARPLACWCERESTLRTERAAQSGEAGALPSRGAEVALRRGARRGHRTRRPGERWPLAEKRDAGVARDHARILRGSLIEAVYSAGDLARTRIVEVNWRRHRGQFVHVVLPRAGR